MNPINLIELLANGEFHSGQDIADSFSISRTAVWKCIQRLTSWGLEVDSVRGRGYRLRPALELFQVKSIESGLDDFTRSVMKDITLLAVVDSTNRHLKACLIEQGSNVEQRNKVNQGKDSRDNEAVQFEQIEQASVCLAEYQTHGRGRRGRNWYSPFGTNLLMSSSWRFESLPAQVNTLSLVLGVAIVGVLSKMGATDLKLKWPNDLVWQGKKLGGILFELFTEESGGVYAIAGIGLNLRKNQQQMERIDQAWTALEEVMAEKSFSRNQIVSQLLNAICAAFQHFEDSGADEYLDQWRKLDFSYGQMVSLILPNKKVTGESLGIDQQGRFLLKTNAGVEAFVSGEISLRINS